MLYPELDIGSREALLDLLHPDLAAALRDGSPGALMSIVRGSDHVSPCRLTDGVCPGVEANGAPQGVYVVACAKVVAGRALTVGVGVVARGADTPSPSLSPMWRRSLSKS